MAPLHRHQIAWLSREGWQQVLTLPWDDEALACLKHWAGHRLPLVVTRQPDALPAGHVALGLCAPARWERRRIAVQLPLADMAYFDEFPALDRIVSQLPGPSRGAARALALALRRLGVSARAFGSHGWQALTGLEHVRPGSDLDLWLGVNDPRQADAAVALLAGCGGTTRLDGELIFPGDRAVAWREWEAWRAGRSRALLVKQLDGAHLVTSITPFEPMAEAA